MSLSIVFTGRDIEGCGYPFALASASDWMALRRWLKAQPQDTLPLLRRLARTGQAEDTLALRAEVRQARDVAPAGDVRACLDTLLDRIGVGSIAETALILGDD